MELKRVVITGLGAVTPLGNNVKEFAENLSQGVSGCDLITRFNYERFKTKFACEVKGFDPSAHFDRKEARKMDLFAQFAMVAVKEAMEDSQIDLSSIIPRRYGVIWASGIGGIETFLQEVKSYASGDGTPRFNPFFIPKMISDIAAGLISIKYNFQGPNFSTVSACASSTNAIIDSLNYIRLGQADVIITGGSEAAINEAGMAGFNAMQAISTKNEAYQTASRPFDKTRDGFVMGEGGGAIIMEELEHAKKRGAKIYAEVIGGGLSADAYHLTAPNPEGIGAGYVMENALNDANINPEEVDYINAHGTATPVGDLAEEKGIKRVFKDHTYQMNISSTKSMTGHLLGAAGAVEAMAAIVALNEGFIPPTINHFEDDPELDSKINYTFNKTQERKMNIALSNTFGFGGHNASVLLRKNNF